MGNLHHEIDEHASERRSPRRVLRQGTTAKPAPPFGNPEWWEDLEYVWRARTYAGVQALTARARAVRREMRSIDEYGGGLNRQELRRLERSACWAESRARAMAMTRRQVIDSCGNGKRKVACGCGVIELEVGCEQPTLCERCRRRHWKRWRRRITRAMDAHLAAQIGEWRRAGRGYQPGIYLLTFTMPHSGSIEADRSRMGKAWHELLKRAAGWWRTYALTWEVTRGTQGDGHVHMHVAAISQWIPYDELRIAWQHVMPGAIQPDVVSPKQARDRAKQMKRRYTPAGSAAYYLAKYVTKGVDPTEFSGQKAGELLVAFRGRRKVSTSLKFWRPLRDRDTRCRKCGQRHLAIGKPAGLRSRAPGAWLGAMANRISWWGNDRLLRHGSQCTWPAVLEPPDRQPTYAG